MLQSDNRVTFLCTPKTTFFIEKSKERYTKVHKPCVLHFSRSYFHKILIYNNIYIILLKYLLRGHKIRGMGAFPEKKERKKKKRRVLRFCVLLLFLDLKSLFINTARSTQSLCTFVTSNLFLKICVGG